MERKISQTSKTPGRPNPPPRRQYIKKAKVYDPLSHWKSAWIVTINTNQNNPDLIEPLEIVWDYILEHITAFVYGRGYIINVKEEHRVFEQGAKYHRIHMHTKVEIETNGIAYLDFVKITQFINRQLRQIPSFKGVYFNAALIKNYNNPMSIEEYLRKAPYLQRPTQKQRFQII